MVECRYRLFSLKPLLLFNCIQSQNNYQPKLTWIYFISTVTSNTEQFTISRLYHSLRHLTNAQYLCFPKYWIHLWAQKFSLCFQSTCRIWINNCVKFTRDKTSLCWQGNANDLLCWGFSSRKPPVNIVLDIIETAQYKSGSRTVKKRKPYSFWSPSYSGSRTVEKRYTCSLYTGYTTKYNNISIQKLSCYSDIMIRTKILLSK